MRFLFLEPFYGGSHRAVADGLLDRSHHEIDLHTLPDRFWKWRMRGAALHFARKVGNPEGYDGIIASNLMSISDLRSLWGTRCPPILVYHHENQFSYPMPRGATIDYQFAFTDVTTGLAADRIRFNSETHFESYFRDLERFLKILPDYRPKWAATEIRARSGVLHPGCDFPAGDPELRPPDRDGPPLIIWNHRWEFDKQPEIFFAVLEAVRERGRDFRLALLGENFQIIPKEFEAARERYGNRIVRYGYVLDRGEYIDWLRRGAIVISTALQENFGIAVVEAIRYGCYPLLPNRLSYPELLRDEHRSLCLYDDEEDLVDRLTALLARSESIDSFRKPLAESMERFSWDRRIEDWDAELERLVSATGRRVARPTPA